MKQANMNGSEVSYMKIREKKQPKFLVFPKNFEHCQGRPQLPFNCPTRKTLSDTSRENCCLATKQNESELKTLNSTFAKGQKFACDARKGQCANQQLTHTSRASSGQHAQTPNTRVEATSPGICDKPCHQQPRNAVKATSVHHVGSVQTRDRTPRNRSPTHHL